MSIIEDDSRNGMVPPPAGDSTRSLQASCDHACSRVTSSMFVGGGRIARDQHVLLQSGITHVLNCAGVSCDDYFPQHFQYRTLMLRDTGREDITPYLFSALEFIHGALLSGGKIFIHCVKGISRSPAVAIAYMVWSTNVTLEQACKRMKQVRPISDPNAGFIFQLREWCDIPPSLVLKQGKTLIYRIAGPPHFKITDRAGDAVCSLAASVGPLFVLPTPLEVAATTLTAAAAAAAAAGSASASTMPTTVATMVSTSHSTSRKSSTKSTTSSTSGKSSTTATPLISSTQHEDDCYLVCCANVTWLWHTQSCSLRLLEMGRSVARQLQVIAGASNYTVTVVQGQETTKFVQAITCNLCTEDTLHVADEEDNSDQEMGNPQEMSM